jgi:hypothetical protein
MESIVTVRTYAQGMACHRTVCHLPAPRGGGALEWPKHAAHIWGAAALASRAKTGERVIQ